MLKEEAHSQKMADAAVGLGTDNRRAQHTDTDSEPKEVMQDIET